MSAQQLLIHLRNLSTYLSSFPAGTESIYFENLVARVFSELLKIPFFSNSNVISSITFRTTWLGDHRYPIKGAPSGKPDIVARCHNYYLIIEATQKTGANQWTDEFASSVKHTKKFIAFEGCNENQTYILLITPKISDDTYISLKNHPKLKCKFIPLEVTSLADILETTIFAFTLKHLDIRQLLMEIPTVLKSSNNLDEYRNSLNYHINNWKKDIFRRERNTIIAIRSYEAMKKIRRKEIGESEILQILQKSDDVIQYLSVIGEEISGRIIEDSLVSQNLTIRVTTSFDDEKFFHPVPYLEFKNRNCKILKTLKVITEEVVS